MYWQRPPQDREQIVLFSQTLDERIPSDHPVRLLDELLATYDWIEWEKDYVLKRGQPPIHPRVLAATLLYGMARGIRTSRKLEYAVKHNVDFIWLVEGRSLDHTTISEFRRKFSEPLKDLHKHICRTAMKMGALRLAEVAIDGTRIRANNGRYNTQNAEKIEKLLKQLDQQFEEALGQVELADATDAVLWDPDESFDRLPADLADIENRRKALKEVLAQLEKMEKSRRREGTSANPAQIPSADTDSRVLPNKEGGYAPNFTPMAMADVASGFIISTDVLPSATEQSVMTPMVEDVYATFGSYPEAILGDGVYSTGENLEGMAEREIDQYSPLPVPAESENPALREDPTQPIAAEDRERLPIDPHSKQIDKAAFIYDSETDRYYCPDGRVLEYEGTKKDTRRGQQIERRVYRSSDCSGCPLAERCISKKSKKGRSVSRDIHEERRQAHAAKMATDEAKAIYAKRFHAAEVGFATLKHEFGLRRFLLRGLANVKTEWLWGCTAYNLKKLIKLTGTMRTEQSKTATEGVR